MSGNRVEAFTPAEFSAFVVSNLDQVLAEVEKTRICRVEKALQRRPVVVRPDPRFQRTVLVVDVETTGTNPDIDDVTEFACLKVTINDEGKMGDVVASYSSLREPHIPIPPDITLLTNITNDDVAGKTLDVPKIVELLSDVEFVVAHNAKFDRSFCSKMIPEFECVPWACSLDDIPWHTWGLVSQNLSGLLKEVGYYHGAHRALDDCYALLEILDPRWKPLPQEPCVILYDTIQRPRVRIDARKTRFTMNGELKKRGYRWNGSGWSITVEIEEEAAELAYLKQKARTAYTIVHSETVEAKYSPTLR
ncbi:3'-5' exonuclease [Agrobacterium larrymoorei]|uniref:3'-5' exonuclease n=1 Tax=Agrobacterium larrymoorei TaxID=160699 RepID=UPI00286B49CE|nr:3'-5' exonuclease [Agrobacterium larrymoorei]